MSVLPAPTDQRPSDPQGPLIAAFEEEQKTTVFSALSEYLHQNLFCDVSLVVGHQILRAHKVVLASSSKFFSNALDIIHLYQLLIWIENWPHMELMSVLKMSD